MLIEGLRSRIQRAADAGEKRAQELLTKIETAEGQKQSADRHIVDATKELSFLDGHELSDLNTFWEKRSVFVHPYETEPTEPESTYLIEWAVQRVLSRDIYYRKPYIDRELTNIEVRHYLPDDEGAVRRHASQLIARIARDLYPYFFKALLAAFGRLKDDASAYRVVLRIRFYLVELAMAAQQRIEENDPLFRLEDFATNRPVELIAGACAPECWPLFPERVRKMLVDYVLDHISDQYATISPTNVFVELIRQGHLSDTQKDAFREQMDALEFATLSNFVAFSDLMADKILSELGTGDFYRIIPVISYLTGLSRESLESLDEARLVMLGREVTAAAVANSWASQNYLKSVGGMLDRLPDALVAGLFFGQFFPYDEELHAKLDYLSNLTVILEERLGASGLRHWYSVFAVLIGIAQGEVPLSVVIEKCVRSLHGQPEKARLFQELLDNID